jgi:squalene-hopene/tetraprenyl-beta-curcumene cyclase
MRHVTLPLVVTLLAVCLVGASCTKEPKPVADTGSGGEAEVTRVQGDQAAAPAPSAADPDYVAPGTQAAIDKAVAYLRRTQQADGGWLPMEKAEGSDMGISAVAALGLLRAGVPADDPMVAKAVNYLVGFQKDDGGIYDKGYRNYTTSICLMLLKATGDSKYDEAAGRALAFLKNLQWDEGEGLGAESEDFGGAGYGNHKRPDLSNTQWFIEAVREAGLTPDDPALKNALVFVSRTQATEEARFISLPDGSFIYTPHGGGESKAPEIVLPSGQKGLKGYGSMTYAGFLSLIYCGLDKEDKRVQAALKWLGDRWTLEENPELGKQGYYYYLMIKGKALRAYGEPTITDAQGTAHPWRKQLSAKLIELQNEDGSWMNDMDRWHEGYKPLLIGYALQALDACKAEL